MKPLTPTHPVPTHPSWKKKKMTHPNPLSHQSRIPPKKNSWKPPTPTQQSTHPEKDIKGPTQTPSLTNPESPKRKKETLVTHTHPHNSTTLKRKEEEEEERNLLNPSPLQKGGRSSLLVCETQDEFVKLKASFWNSSRVCETQDEFMEMSIGWIKWWVGGLSWKCILRGSFYCRLQ